MVRRKKKKMAMYTKEHTYKEQKENIENYYIL